MVTLEDFLAFHKGHFLPAYSELVAYLGDKPNQVLIEIENLSAHLINYLSTDGENQQENLTKAYNHLVRVTVDCYKILWIQIDKEIEALIAAQGFLEALTVPADKFLAAKQAFKRGALAARNLEMKSIGVNPTDCYHAYANVIYFGFAMLKLCDFTGLHACVGEMPPEDYVSGHAPVYKTFDEAMEQYSVEVGKTEEALRGPA